MVDAVDVDPVSIGEPTGSEAEEEDRDEDVQSDGDPQTPNSESEPGSEEESEVRPTPNPFAPGSRKKGPAWVDPDDLDVQVSLASDKRLRKLRETTAEDEIGGRDYERRLRRQFEKLNPTPQWASDARKKRSTVKRRRSISPSSVSEEDLDPLTSTGGVLERKQRRSGTLSQKTINIERLRDANVSARAEGELRTVQFHPSAQVPMLLTASADRRLRLFNVRIYFPSHLSKLMNLNRSTVIRILTYKLSTFQNFRSVTPVSIRVEQAFS